ncbi:hypothetical protein EV385_0513 [Krasilnikovia cinnamomea]|uniref:Ig-like domain-containing protein n=1 Tax=Krasilnikovia cinnamomea TaxID=349313 RepID=A0A4Q7ZFL9_9ACTN|nr:Ig-like domain-containing protein [Krasilnikovia cinnamomea]RZU48789.1 hypothetical protein EV385_0513 [Krasilnikovia cinnamomea]
MEGRRPGEPGGQVAVILTDHVGNSSALSTVVQVDNDPPAGRVLTPEPGARLRGTFTSTLTGVSDLSGVVTARLRVNGTLVGTDTTAPYALAVKTGTYSGNLALSWTLTDRWGQPRTLPPRTVAADNTGPSLSITKAPTNNATVKGTVTVYAKASDPSGVARLELLVNGKVVAKDTTSVYALRVNTTTQKKTMKVQVRAYDKLGNTKIHHHPHLVPQVTPI